MSALSYNQTYVLAHTAQCKLQLSANRPDRNLRFVLGHALAFESLMLRIVEIEEEQHSAKHAHEDQNSSTASRVSFVDNSNRPTGDLRREQPSTRGRKPSPPPDPALSRHDGAESDSDEEDYVDEEEFDDSSLGLVRFGSASAYPPRTLDCDNEDEEDEPTSPPPVFSESMLKEITEGEGDEGLADLYECVRSCGCQSHVDGEAPAISSIWEIPSKSSEKQAHEMRRTAVIQVRV
jgi:hypothetical protein